MTPTINDTNTAHSHLYRTYGQYTSDPTAAQLEQFFTLEPRDHALIATYPERVKLEHDHFKPRFFWG